MQSLSYILTSIIAYLGIIFGIILAYIAKDEIEPGKRYFIIMKAVISGMTIGFLLMFYDFYIIISILAFVIISVLLLYKDHRLYRDYGINCFRTIDMIISYLIFGIIFYLTSIRLSYFLIISCLIFLHGLAAGTLALDRKFRNKWKIILTSSPFIIISVGIYLII